MSDLGLNNLGDEQLIGLLNEAVAELLSRDPVVHKVAQTGIITLADKRDAFVATLHQEIKVAKDNYIASLRQKVRGEIFKAIQTGELRVPGLVSSTEEADIVVEMTKEQIQRMKEDLVRAPEKSSFAISYNGNHGTLRCSYHSAGKNWDNEREIKVIPNHRQAIRQAVLGAFGIPVD